MLSFIAPTQCHGGSKCRRTGCKPTFIFSVWRRRHRKYTQMKESNGLPATVKRKYTIELHCNSFGIPQDEWNMFRGMCVLKNFDVCPSRGTGTFSIPHDDRLSKREQLYQLSTYNNPKSHSRYHQRNSSSRNFEIYLHYRRPVQMEQRARQGREDR